eukprot:484666-Rhodomonas_salina.1
MAGAEITWGGAGRRSRRQRGRRARRRKQRALLSARCTRCDRQRASERASERERERQGDREGGRQRQRQRQRQREGERGGARQRQRQRQRAGEREGERALAHVAESREWVARAFGGSVHEAAHTRALCARGCMHTRVRCGARRWRRRCCTSLCSYAGARRCPGLSYGVLVSVLCGTDGSGHVQASDAAEEVGAARTEAAAAMNK